MQPKILLKNKWIMKQKAGWQWKNCTSSHLKALILFSVKILEVVLKWWNDIKLYQHANKFNLTAVQQHPANTQ